MYVITCVLFRCRYARRNVEQSQGSSADARCGPCRLDDLYRGGSGRADLVGSLIYDAEGVRWIPYKKQSIEMQHGGVMVAEQDPETVDEAFPRLVGTLKTKCRNGHDLRVRLERVLGLRTEAEKAGVVYLPGN